MKTMTTNTNNQKGFTLIELIIAMGLSVIILAAIGGIFIYTNKLNQAATEEIKQQQTVRNLSNLISRDASMAGYFGCFSLGTLADPIENYMRGDLKIGSNIKLWQLPDPKDQSDKQLVGASLGVDWRPATDFVDDNLGNIKNFTPLDNSHGLAFYYAQGSAKIVDSSANDELSFAARGLEGDLIRTVAQNKGILSLSSCRALHNFKAKTTKIDTATGIITVNIAEIGPVPLAENSINHFDPNTMQLMRFSPVVYLVGKPNNCTNCTNGLYRFELLSNGTWSSPELLIDKANAMSATFYYTTMTEAVPPPPGGTAQPDKIIGCPVANDDLNEFSFIKSSNSLYPAQLDINYGLLPAKLDLTINVANTTPIQITSAIQAGNICANRKFDVPDPATAPSGGGGGGTP